MLGTNLKSLTSLTLHFIGYDNLRGYKGILKLIVDNNLIEIVKGLKKLTHLILPHNCFTKYGFREIAKIDNNLIFLDVSRGRFSLSNISESSKFSKLLYLCMDDYTGVDVNFKILKYFKGLIGLSVRRCNITNKEAELIVSNLPNLIYLDISLNDNGITKISEGLKYLSFLNIEYSKISNNGFRAITSNLNNLTHLDIRLNPIKCVHESYPMDEGRETIDTLSRLTNLSFLSLQYCGIGNDNIKDIQKLSHLITLRIDINDDSNINNNTTGELLDMKNLVELVCNRNTYANIGTKEWEKLKRLIFFGVSDSYSVSDNDEINIMDSHMNCNIFYGHGMFLYESFLERIFMI